MQSSRTSGYRDGWQTLLVDGLTAGAVIAALDSRDRSDAAAAIVIIGAGAFAMGSPIVHFAHGHAGKGAASLAIRGGCAAVLGLGTAAGTAPQVLAVALLGMIAAIPIDAAILAREDVSAEQAARTSPSLELRVAPAVDPRASGFTLSAVGEF